MKVQKNKIETAIIMLFCWAMTIHAQQLEQMYVNMPDRLNPTLTAQNRLELIEYFKAGQKDTVTNRFGNPVQLLMYDSLNYHLKVQNTPVSVFEMKMFQLKGQTVIGLIRTVCSPVCQSAVEFYDTAWSPVDVQFTLPKATEWIDYKKINHQVMDTTWLKNALQPDFITLTFQNNGNAVIAENHTPEFLSESEQKDITPFLHSDKLLFDLVSRKWEWVK